MVRTQIRLDENQYARLKSVAKQEKVSIAELVRRGVDLIVEKADRTNDSMIKANALAALGQFSDEAVDVSLEHDQYLAEVLHR